ncbi:MAG: transposase, partial [Pseudomonadota bacterium]|nr:transposase [Pseudomonadota bacterium]
MKKSRFTDSQIIAILKQAEAGTPVAEVCREHGISNATFYNWRSKYGGM